MLNAANSCPKEKGYVWSDVLPNLLDIARVKHDEDKAKEVAKYVPEISCRLVVDIS